MNFFFNPKDIYPSIIPYVAAIVLAIAAVAAIIVAIPIARSAWGTIIGFIARRR